MGEFTYICCEDRFTLLEKPGPLPQESFPGIPSPQGPLSSHPLNSPAELPLWSHRMVCSKGLNLA